MTAKEAYDEAYKEAYDEAYKAVTSLPSLPTNAHRAPPSRA